MAVLGDGKGRVERPAPTGLEDAAVTIYQRARNAFELLPTGDAILNPRLTEDNSRDTDLLRHAGMLLALALLNRMTLGFSVDVDTLDRILSAERSPEEPCPWPEQQYSEGFFSIIQRQSFDRLEFSSADVRGLPGGRSEE